MFLIHGITAFSAFSWYISISLGCLSLLPLFLSREIEYPRKFIIAVWPLISVVDEGDMWYTGYVLI